MFKNKHLPFALCVFFASGMQITHAAVDCQIKVLKTVTDDMGNQFSKGQVIPVDIQRIQDKKVFYCAHGGSCIPARVKGVKTIALTNCKPGVKIGDQDRRLTALK